MWYCSDVKASGYGPCHWTLNAGFQAPTDGKSEVIFRFTNKKKLILEKLRTSSLEATPLVQNIAYGGVSRLE